MASSMCARINKGLALPARSTCRRVVACPARPAQSRRATVCVKAELKESPLTNVQGALDSFFKRYDVLSTGAGALLVTSYCVYVHGQDPFTALSITFTSTVVALVANELLFNGGRQQ